MWFGFLLLFSAFAGLSLGQRVLNVKARTVQEAKKINEMADSLNLDVWHYPRTLDDSFQILIPSEVDGFFATWLDHSGITTTVMVEDVGKLIDDEKRSIQRSRRISGFADFDFETYNIYESIYNYVTKLNSATSQANVETGIIGATAEGRDIVYIKLSSKGGEAASSIFIDCGIHAREWISPAFCMHVINQLANIGGNEDMLKKYNWYIVPVLNPDGYAYSHSDDRLWRKNRFRNIGNDCIGVDLNRNFGYHFNFSTSGTSPNPCSQVYIGTRAFSEAESAAVSNFILALKSKTTFDAYLTIHSYGQMWLYPWGYTSELPEDWQDLESVANVTCDALKEKYKTRYVIGSSTNVLYAAAGGSDDWAKGGAGIKYSYTLELRDTGRYGFVLPTNQIKRTCDETWDALVAMVNVLKG